MNDAELYQNNSSLQKRDSLRCLEQHAKRIKWKRTDRVMDIGCGDGSLSVVLRSYSPHKFQLVGSDISVNMVKYANQNHADEQTVFTLLNIEGKLPEKFVGSFDHVFSFYAFHWIRNQKLAFQNVYNMLSRGGDCLLLFVGRNPIFDVYRILVKHPRWGKYLKDVENYISPYHDSLDPGKEIAEKLKNIGFVDIEVKHQQVVYCFKDETQLKKAAAAVCPFSIPKNDIEDYLTDYEQIVKNMRANDKTNNNADDGDYLRMIYNTIVIYASKSNRKTDPDKS